MQLILKQYKIFLWEIIIWAWHNYYNQPINSWFICSSLFFSNTFTHVWNSYNTLAFCTMKNIWSCKWIQMQREKERKNAQKISSQNKNCLNTDNENIEGIWSIWSTSDSFSLNNKDILVLFLQTSALISYYLTSSCPCFLTTICLSHTEQSISLCVCLILRNPISGETCSYCWNTVIMIWHSLQKYMSWQLFNSFLFLQKSSYLCGTICIIFMLCFRISSVQCEISVLSQKKDIYWD